MARFIVVDYNEGKRDKPRIALQTDNLKEGEKKVDELAKTNIDRCVIFYDMAQNKILRIIMLCEPIYTVRAIEFAKSEWVKSKHYVKEGTKLAVQGGAGAVIGEIAQRLAGQPMPGVSSAVLGHILAPYYAVKGDEAAAGGAAAGMYGGLSGAIIGFVVGGPVGAFIGGVIGGAGLGTGTSALIRAACHPDQCSKCKGVGFDADYERCTWCDGYGYTKGKR